MRRAESVLRRAAGSTVMTRAGREVTALLCEPESCSLVRPTARLASGPYEDRMPEAALATACQMVAIGRRHT
jgi:hypothetical protein